LLTPAVARKIAPLRRLLTLLFQDAGQAGTLADVVEKILERTQFLEYLDADRDGESVDRAANVEELVRAAESFDLRLSEDLDEAGETTDVWDEGDPLRIGQFLSETALEGGTDKGPNDDATALMTFHAAKGLEFPVVFLVGVEQGLLPHARAVFGESASDEDLEEERRLMYVGLTRAEKRAYLTFAAQRTLHGRTETTTPSQFIDEIPAHLLKREGVAAGGSRWVQQRSSSWGSRGRDEFESLPRPASESNPFSSASPTKARDAEPPTFSCGRQGETRHLRRRFGGGSFFDRRRGRMGGSGVSGTTGKKKLIVSYANLEKA
jgi:DNA helicase-2/ATP-dependent DNA helicase PcrA